MAVVLATDWKLEVVAGRTYGMCTCSWAPPFERFDFERGFALPNPSNVRVAAQSLLWALESLEGCAWFNRMTDTVVVSTKSFRLNHIMESAPSWVESGRWPKSQQEVRALCSKCCAILKSLNASKSDFVSIVYIEREESDKVRVDLDEHRTEDGFDMDSFVKRGASNEEIEEAVQETRMRGVMAEKLVTSGARCYRSGKRHK